MVDTKIVCEQCGEADTVFAGKFCSRSCFMKYRYNDSSDPLHIYTHGSGSERSSKFMTKLNKEDNYIHTDKGRKEASDRMKVTAKIIWDKYRNGELDMDPYALSFRAKYGYTPCEFKLVETGVLDQLGKWVYNHSVVDKKYKPDFYFKSLNLIIEVDGVSHDQEKDRIRDEFHKSHNIDTIRVTNQEIEEDINGVVRRLLSVV